MHSAVYIGSVAHARLTPIEHRFRYRLFMIYIDLDELSTVFSGTPFWSAKRPSLAWFRRTDYHGDPSQPLTDAVQETVHQKTGKRSKGPIRMLTHLRYYGYCFNPVTFYYCFDETGSRLEAVMAEVTNTPWQERHCYIATCDARKDYICHQFDKSFHVSPFMGMNVGYDLSCSTPASRIHVKMNAVKDNTSLFEATLSLQRRPISPWLLNMMLINYPFMTLRVVTAIYWQALRLKLKGAPFYLHPAKGKTV